ncbi:MAG: group III truncated hemoglobin [Methylocystis sp.]
MEPAVIPPIEDGAERAKLEVAIDDCVRSFYAKGAKDALLGPIFSAIDDLDHHMGIVANFWSKSLLGTERYEGQPFAVHINLPIEPEHFTRWLELFTESASATLPKTQAEQAIAKAAHMTQCFQAGLFPFVGADGKPSRVPAQ